jgi:predicted transglutaminase-like cysteine proteinase
MAERQGILNTVKTYLNRNRLGELMVVRRHLTPAELKQALDLQKQDHRPLGRILVEEGYVTQNQIRAAVTTQYALRGAAAAITLFVSAFTFDARTASAGSLKEIPAQITLASASVGNVAAYPSLFGTGEKRSGDLSAFVKWSAMFERFERDSNSAQGQRVMAQWKADLETMRGLPLEDMVEAVNTMANKVRYIGDNKNWGKSDYWETPVEFFINGGDCEDFAITKYISLRALGVPDNRMRVAIVKDMEKGIPHAILVVYGDNGTYVLDNQIKTVRSTQSISHYKPIFSINRSAWWLHTNPGSTMVASAAGQ